MLYTPAEWVERNYNAVRTAIDLGYREKDAREIVGALVRAEREEATQRLFSGEKSMNGSDPGQT